MSDIMQKTILLVEDMAILAITEKSGLEKYGYKVITANSGEKAIDLVCFKKEKIDLILMDINLGEGMDGTETAREILKVDSIPILFLSSHTEKEIVDKTEKISSYGYVVKSSSFTVLDASIKMAFKLYDANHLLAANNQTLHHQTQLLESVIDKFPGFVLWKDLNSKFLGCNLNFAQKCGFSTTAEIIGKTDRELPFYDDEVDSFLDDDRMVMQTKTAKLHFEEREHVANGEEIILDTCKFPLFNSEGQIAGILAVAVDITEYKKKENDLKVKEDELELMIKKNERLNKELLKNLEIKNK